MEFSLQIFEKYLIPNFMKTRPVGTETLHADGLKDRHDEANIRFRNFANEPKKLYFVDKGYSVFRLPKGRTAG
jgi:hypothetical protein